jgi:hypothetical protein
VHESYLGSDMDIGKHLCSQKATKEAVDTSFAFHFLVNNSNILPVVHDVVTILLNLFF